MVLFATFHKVQLFHLNHPQHSHHLHQLILCFAFENVLEPKGVRIEKAIKKLAYSLIYMNPLEEKNVKT